MDVFGITPIDAGLSAAGLNISQVLGDFLFKQSKIAFLAFVIGLFLCLWQCAKTASYGRLIRHLAIGIGCFLLTAMPVLLSFSGRAVDSFIFGSIAAFSRSLPDHARFLEHPFGLQFLSLRLHQEIEKGVRPQLLKEKAADFAYAWYLPALTRLRQGDDSIKDLADYGPSHEKIDRFYPAQVKEEWRSLKEQIKVSLRGPDAIWPKATALTDSFQFNGRGLSEDQLIDALLQTEAQGAMRMENKENDAVWDLAAMGLNGYFYLQGGANLCLYLAFPIVLCLTLVFARLEYPFLYIRFFLSVKSLSLTAALASLISLNVAQLALRTHEQAHWFWQEPYFVLSTALLVYLLPMGTFFLMMKDMKSTDRIRHPDLRRREGSKGD